MVADTSREGLTNTARAEHLSDAKAKRVALRALIPGTGEYVTLSAVDNGDGTYSLKTVGAGGAGGGDGAILDGVSASIKASVLDYTSSKPLAVRLTDTSGNYVGAGAGTQYTEGDTDASITGSALMFEGAADTLIAAPGTAANGLDVDVTRSALPTGAATSAKQDTAQTALDAIKTSVETIDNAVSGTELQVDVLTMPTTTVQATNLDIRDLTNTDVVTAELSATDNAVLDDIAANQTDATQKTQIVDGAGAVIGSTANALDVNIASGSSANTEYTEDAAAPANPTAPALSLVRDDALSGQTTADGDIVVARGTDKGEIYVKHADTLPISASALPLPTGASTSAKQDSIITELQNIDTGKLEEATFTGRIGEVQATPTANTLLARLKTIADNQLPDSHNVTVDNSVAVTGTFWQATQPISASSLPLPTGAATAANQSTLIGHVDGIEGLLTTIDADTSALAGTVSGSELQVDIVSMPSITANLAGDDTDLDSGAGTDNHDVVAIGLPASGGHVVGGTATDPLRTDPTGDTIQPVSGTVTANLSATDNAVLDAIEADTTTIAGAVSGTEMQVDVLTMPTTTVTATDLDIRNLSQTQDSVLIYGSDDGGTTKRVIKTDSGGAIQVDLEVTNVDTELTTGDLDTGAGTDTRAVIGLVGSKSGGGELIPGSATDGLLVNLGANNDVTVSSIAAGDNNIGNVDVVSSALPTGAATAANQQTDALTDTELRATPVPVSGTVTANLSATDNAVLDTVETNTDFGTVVGGGTETGALRVTIANNSTGVLTVDGTVTAELSAVDNAVLDDIASDTESIKTAVEILDNVVSGSEAQVDVVAPLPAGTNAIGKLTQPATPTLANVTMTGSSVTLQASNTARRNLMIFNDSGVTVYVKLGSTASATSFTVKMVDQSYYELPDPVYTGIVTALGASGDVRVTEVV